MAAPPATISDHAIPKPKAAPAASRTARPAPTTSGPTPSPAMTTIRYVASAVVMATSPTSRQSLSEVGGGAPRRHPPEDSWQVLRRALSHEGRRGRPDLGPTKLVHGREVGVERGLDDVRR